MLLGGENSPANMGIRTGEESVLLIILVYIILIIVQSGHCSVQRKSGSGNSFDQEPGIGSDRLITLYGQKK